MRLSILLTAALVATATLAIEPPKDRPAAPAPEAGEPAASPAPPDEPAAETPSPAVDEVPEELPPLPPDVVDTGPPPQRFTPTEKVRADFPVSYPIDI